ncbi:hypothetical protein VDG1235_3431 [Verrucomicrobiia bacterium DG1235]|nr:hypothetical protein VDG1235_3431 [Verrucomicrobiae bacterium DG1235]
MLKIDEREGLYRFRHEAMATELVLSLGGVDADYARQAAQAFFARVDEVEAKLSLYQESSDVTRINLLEAGTETRVSEECVDCLQVAMLASGLTGERFHPFLGRESLRRKGGEPFFLKHLMAGEGALKGSPAIEIDPEKRRVIKLGEGMVLDFGGIGKGFALDCAMEEIEDWEVPIAMANFGGSTLLFRGEEREGAWTGTLCGEALQPFCSGAISSSGVGFQGEHIVGSEIRWDRSFARCQSAAMADALTTGAMLMSESELDALGAAESGLALAATCSSINWGVKPFCSWKA